MRVSFLVVGLALVASFVGFAGEDSAAPSVEKPYMAVRTAPVEYDIDFRVIVTAPSGTKSLKVWIPVPQNDLGQTISDGEWSVFPTDLKPTLHTEPVFGNRFAYFEFQSPQGAQIIAQSYRAKVWQLDWNVDPVKVGHVEKWPREFDPYRRAERGIVIDDRVKRLAGGLRKDGPANDLDAVMTWVQENMAYDHSASSLVASTDHALARKRGDCSDYHGLCSSLGRALGLPTRVAYGLHLFPKSLPSHCKLEAYLHPYGWVSFDVSETQRLVKSIEANGELTVGQKQELVSAAVARLRRGFRDNTWLLVTKGTDYDLAPAASGKVPLISTIHAEADGKPLPLPDPADPTRREFSWMTAHKYAADRAVPNPFRDWKTLQK